MLILWLKIIFGDFLKTLLQSKVRLPHWWLKASKVIIQTHFTFYAFLSSPHLYLSQQISSPYVTFTAMAAQREKEETELKVPETIPLCVLSTASAMSPESSDPKLSGAADLRSNSVGSPERSGTSVPKVPEIRSLKRPRDVCRCSGAGCRRKVGLVGFRCRCGEVFCSEHRYSDRHDCSFDYKAAGREAIARENPVVRAAKILKVWTGFSGFWAGTVIGRMIGGVICKFYWEQRVFMSFNTSYYSGKFYFIFTIFTKEFEYLNHYMWLAIFEGKFNCLTC